MCILYLILTAFWMKCGDDCYAPKLGMDVQIVDAGFTKHDSNPAHESPFAKIWKILTVGYDSKKMLQVLLHSQSKYDVNGDSIEPMDILTIVPACSLKYSGVRTGYGTVNYTLLSPKDMIKRWNISNDSTLNSDLNVTVSRQVINGKMQKPKPPATTKMSKK